MAGDEGARAALGGTSNSWSSRQSLLDTASDRYGAYWLPAGSVNWDDDVAAWAPAPNASLDADAWKPDDMLVIPLHAQAGDLIALVSVHQPLTGRRPDDARLRLLVAVCDHASIALVHADQLLAALEAPEVSVPDGTPSAASRDLRGLGATAG